MKSKCGFIAILLLISFDSFIETGKLIFLFSFTPSCQIKNVCEKELN